MELFATCMSKNSVQIIYINLHNDLKKKKDKPIEKWPKEIYLENRKDFFFSDHLDMFFKNKYKLKQWDTVVENSEVMMEGNGNVHISGASINWSSPFG